MCVSFEKGSHSFWNDVSLVIDADLNWSPAFTGRAAPDAVLILGEIRNAGIARGLHARFRLRHRETVAASGGVSWRRCIRGGDRWSARPGICRGGRGLGDGTA